MSENTVCSSAVLPGVTICISGGRPGAYVCVAYLVAMVEPCIIRQECALFSGSAVLVLLLL